MLTELAYLVCLTIIEILGIWIGPAAGIILHAGLIMFLFGLYMFRQEDVGWRLWLGLILVSLLRIASLALPLSLVPPLLWAGVICLPVWVGIGLLRGYLRIPAAELGLRKAGWGGQMFIALSGVPLGLVGSLLLNPQPFFPEFTWIGLLLGGALLLVSVAFTEEVLFRGLLLPLAQRALGEAALPFVSALYAVMYIGVQSPGFLLWMGVAGWFWGWCVQETRSLWGVAIAHGLMVVGMGFVWPYFY
ncbi:MAG: CPBP family intramembrane metalloprotease [Anaerolineales bacterium]|nr:CPBP family intramembrane metalloprotease [Anaerolineales bacterium]